MMKQINSYLIFGIFLIQNLSFAQKKEVAKSIPATTKIIELKIQVDDVSKFAQYDKTFKAFFGSKLGIEDVAKNLIAAKNPPKTTRTSIGFGKPYQIENGRGLAPSNAIGYKPVAENGGHFAPSTEPPVINFYIPYDQEYKADQIIAMSSILDVKVKKTTIEIENLRNQIGFKPGAKLQNYYEGPPNFAGYKNYQKPPVLKGLGAPPHPSTYKIVKEDYTVLKTINDYTLLNPPVGSISPEVKKTEIYLNNILKKLQNIAGTDEKFITRINLYSNSKINMFSRTLSHNPFEAEKTFIVENKYLKPWPFRTMIGAENYSDPIYEIGINAGLLHEIKNEDELAFLIAKELSLIKEDVKTLEKTNPFGEILGEQAQSLASDIEAIDWMKKAGYAPESSSEVMSRLYKLNKPEFKEKLGQAFLAGAKGQANEGVRMATIQTSIEKLKQENIRNFKRSTTKAPDYIKFNYHSRKPKLINFNEYKAKAEKVIDNYFVTSTPESWIATYDEKVFVPKIVSELKNFAPQSEHAGEIFNFGLQKIINQPLSKTFTKQLKGDALLRWLMHSNLHSSLRGIPNTENVYRFEQEFIKLTNGKDAWSSTKFLSRISLEAATSTDEAFDLYLRTLTDVDNAKLFKNNFKISSEIKNLYTELYKYRHKNVTKTALNDFLSCRSKYFIDKNSMADDLAKLNYKFLDDELNSTEFWSKKVFTDRIDFEHNLLEYIQNPKAFILSDLEKTRIIEVSKKFTGIREAVLIEKINAPDLIGSGNELATLNQFFDKNESFPLSQNLNKQLEKKLLDISEYWTKNKNVISKSQMFIEPKFHEPFFSEKFTNLLNSKEITKAQKTSIIEFLSMKIDPTYALNANKPEMQNLINAMRTELAEIDPKKLMEIMGKEHFQQNAEILTEAIGKYKQTKPPGKTYGALKLYEKELKNGMYKNLSQQLQDARLGASQSSKGRLIFNQIIERYSETEPIINGSIRQNFNRKLGILSFLSADEKLTNNLVDKISFKDLDKMLKIVDDAFEKKALVCRIVGDFFESSNEALKYLNPKIGVFFLKALEKHQASISFDEWFNIYTRITKYSNLALQQDWKLMDKFESYVISNLKDKPPEFIHTWLEKEEIRKILQPKNLSDLAVKSMPVSVITNQDKVLLPIELEKIENAYILKANHPEALDYMKKNITETFNLQPGESEAIFKDFLLDRTSVKAYSVQTRVLSAISELTREQPYQDQLNMIEYLMGKNSTLPDFIQKSIAASDDGAGIVIHGRVVSLHELADNVPIPEVLAKAREQLASSDIYVRTHVTNSFLAGPNSTIATKEGRAKMISYITKDIKPANKLLATEMAEGILNAQGESQSLAISYILAQPVRGEAGVITESQVLRNILDAYGVPGKKLGQYLAFTSELKDYKEALEELQDAASSLTYSDALKSIEERFGKDWPKNLKIKKILGIGSVNSALEYEDLLTGKTGVLSIAQTNIEKTAQYDFERFKNVIKELTKSEAGMKKYGYLSGLTDIVEKSVNLEFDKEAAFNVQKFVQPLYNRTVDGWTIKTVDAFEQKNMAIFMEKAKGVTARKLLKSDPAAYKSAMKAMSNVEMDVLRGIGQDGMPNAIPLIANPDFHDGQVIIDVANKTATILDFGQAVKITNAEREFAVDLLRITSKTDSTPAVLKLIMKSEFAKTLKSKITVAEIAELLKRTERMDVFVNLVSLLNRKGMDVPLSSVHWVLAANRQIALGEKIGVNNLASFKHRIIADKIGLDQNQYNKLHNIKESVCDFSVISTLRSLVK